MSKRRSVSEYAAQLQKIENAINADPARAARALRALRKRAQAAGEPDTLLIYCDLLVGRCMQRRGFQNEAFKQISQSTRKLDALGAGREAATGYHYMSQINAGRNDMQSALECCLRGQEIAKRARDWYLQMNLEIDMSPVYRSFGEIRSSLNAYLRGLDIYNKHVKGKDARIAGQEEYTEFIIALNIAIQYYNLKEYDRAKQYLDAIAGREMTVLNGAYIDLYNLEYSRVCFGAELIDEGIARADVVIERMKLHTQRSLQSMSNNFLGLIDDLIKSGELDRAWQLISLAKPIIERDNNPHSMCLLSMMLAEYHRVTGRLEEAVQYYNDYVLYNEKSKERDTDDTRQSVLRRVELQKTLDRNREAAAARTRQLESLRQQMEYRAEREQILTNISENTDAFFLIYNPPARTVDFASQNSRRLFGFDISKADDPCARLIEWLSIPEEHAAKILSGELKARVSADYKTRNLETGAPMIIHQELIPAEDKPHIMVLYDVTRVMETQESLVTAIEAARQASAAKTSFLSNMSHDIRTPLNVVIGLLDMLEDNIGNPNAAKAHIADMRRASNHLLALINDMLDMSRIEAGQLKLAEDEFNMPDFLRSVMAIMRPQASARGQSLTLDANDIGEQTLIGDTLNLHKAFINILGNAVKFTPNGGKITLRARELRARRGDIDYQFEFEDTGRGMTPEFLAKIFNPFEREEKEVRTVEGTGLGMAITKSIVDMMNGALDVKSAPGAGTVFTLTLTFKRKTGLPHADAAQEAAIAPLPLNTRKGYVLLVDDNPLNRDIACYVINKFGCATKTAENGRKALDIFISSEPGEISMIFMDVRMPEMNGYEATKRIRALDRPDAASIPIIAMTADAFDEDVRMALSTGMNAHIAKPLSSQTVFETLDQYMK